MFVARRDLLHARGRFALMGSVIVLIALLVGLLSGLTAGLGRENTSAVTGLSADRISFAAPADGENLSFTDSTVPESTWRSWAEVAGVESAEPLGVAMTRARSGDTARSLAAFGVNEGSSLAPPGRLDEGHAVLSVRAAEELGGLREGDTFSLGERELRVGAVEGDAMYSHTPVVWTPLPVWQSLGGPPAAGDGASREAHAGVVALRGGDDAAVRDADRRVGTRTVPLEDSLEAIGSYRAENSSLQLMRGFLFAISALVIGAFFTVWTIQRSADVAVLKALGASTAYVLRDALGQAALLLVGGVGLGTGLAALAGAAVEGSVPFVLDPATVLVPSTVMTVLGLLGAALAIRRVVSVDPLIALGSAR
ncbi:ABC transporter permease [Streptomyces sp. XM4193]|uniref:ABC transporter permease n=1 Tax=Streptomyces sp. XM4193 TaxID=2929782 RepID=UPI001FF84BE8|nr:ABC transporter permease [Streptomyces sp. XM4193]MCK1795018.1 ABC transporter permease [Streptomyces sp. XM4193]